MKKKIFIRNRKGLKVAIDLTLNSGRGRLVFLEHGLSSRKEYPHMKVMEETFAENGYNVVNFDATNSLNESESSSEGLTFSSHYEDLVDVIEWAKTQEFYSEPFALAGQSLGGASCLNYACEHPEKVDLLIVACCPFIDGKKLVENDEMMKKIEEVGYFDKVSRSVNRTLRINKIFNDDVKTYDMTDKIKNIKAKTFVVQGLLDAEYIKKTAHEIYDLLECDKHLILLENTPHDLANTPQTKEIFTNTMRDILKDTYFK